jgi:hypothetical protein
MISIKRWVGLDLIDLAIHAGITVAVGVLIGGFGIFRDEIVVGGVAAASLIVLAARRQQGLRELARRPPDAESPDRVRELESRVSELEPLQDRVIELEERLDFAERLLSQQREPARLRKE